MLDFVVADEILRELVRYIRIMGDSECRMVHYLSAQKLNLGEG